MTLDLELKKTKVKILYFLVDDAFFNRNWVGACWDRWAGTGTTAGPVRWLWMLRPPAKTRNKEGLVGARPSSL